MTYPMRPNDQRQDARLGLDLPAMISIGSQLILQGRVKDLSPKSAFITLKSSVYWKMNDEVGFSIHRFAEGDQNPIQGWARISRIAPGEGLAIYFTKMDDASAERLKALFK